MESRPTDVAPEDREGRMLAFAGFFYDPTNRLLYRDGVEVPLPPRETDLLACLLEHPGRILAKEVLLEEVWGDIRVTDASLFHAVSALRRALGDDPRDPAIVETVHKRGYRLVAEVRPVAPHGRGWREEGGGFGGAWKARRPRPGSMPGRLAMVGAATLFLLVAVAAGAGVSSRLIGEVEVPRLTAPVRTPTPVYTSYQSALALDRDATRMAYVTASAEAEQLYLLSLVDFTGAPIPATEGRPRHPFFSPDGRWLGFFDGGTLWKIDLRGGPRVPLTEYRGSYPAGASWGDDGRIVFSAGPGSGLWTVPGSGGEARQLTRPVGPREYSHLWPEVLPGGGTVLFTVEPPGADGAGQGQIAVGSTLTGEWSSLPGAFGANARYLDDGRVVFARDGGLYAVSYPGSPSDPAIEIADNLLMLPEAAGHFAVAATGLLAYVSRPGDRWNTRLVWADVEGPKESFPLPVGGYHRVRFSPTGARIAVGRLEGQLRIYERGSGSFGLLGAGGGRHVWPVWRDEETVSFSSNREGPYALMTSSVRSALEPTPLPGGASQRSFPGAWTPDGDLLVYNIEDPSSGYDIWTRRTDTGAAAPLIVSPANEFADDLSPDGRWLAYTSDESGRDEVYLRSFPDGERKLQVSTRGGRHAVFSRDRATLYYLLDGAIWRVRRLGADSLSFAAPERVVRLREPVQSFDEDPVSGRLLLAVGGSSTTTDRVRLLLNW